MKQEWLPIETAPETEQEIDIWVVYPDGAGYRVTDVIRDGDCWRNYEGNFLEEYPSFSQGKAERVPTHWMPKPLAPKDIDWTKTKTRTKLQALIDAAERLERERIRQDQAEIAARYQKMLVDAQPDFHARDRKQMTMVHEFGTDMAENARQIATIALRLRTDNAMPFLVEQANKALGLGWPDLIEIAKAQPVAAATATFEIFAPGYPLRAEVTQPFNPPEPGPQTYTATDFATKEDYFSSERFSPMTATGATEALAIMGLAMQHAARRPNEKEQT